MSTLLFLAAGSEQDFVSVKSMRDISFAPTSYFSVSAKSSSVIVVLILLSDQDLDPSDTRISDTGANLKLATDSPNIPERP